MKVNFDQELIDFRGKPILQPDEDKQGELKPFLLKDAVLMALASDVDTDASGNRPKDNERKYRRFMLSQKIYDGGKDTEVSAREVAEIETMLEASPLPMAAAGAARVLLNKVGEEDSKGKRNAKSRT